MGGGVQRRHQGPPIQFPIEGAEEDGQPIGSGEIAWFRELPDGIREDRNLRVSVAEDARERRRARLHRVDSLKGVLPGRAHPLEEVGMIVEFRHHHPAFGDQPGNRLEALIPVQNWPVQDANFRRVRSEFGQLTQVNGDGGIGRGRSQRMDDPHMAYPAHWLQHRSGDGQGGAGLFAHPPDILKRSCAAEIALAIDAQRLECRAERGGEAGGLVTVKHAPLDIVGNEPERPQLTPKAFLREPAQMRLVEEARGLVIPSALEQPGCEAPMLEVGHADEDRSALVQQICVGGEDRPRVPQMLQHVAIDDAVGLLGGERDGVHFDIDRCDVVQARRRDPRPAGILLDPEEPRAGICC